MGKIIISFALLFLSSSCAYSQPESPSIQKLKFAMLAIEHLYVDDVNSEKLTEDAIIEILKDLDPHSEYMDKDEVKKMNEPLQGNFDGIGIQFNMLTDTLYVIQVIPGGPSQKVGMMPGDRIIEVNDTLIAGVKMSTDDITKRLKGKKGTTVSVKVLRSGVPELIEFKIVRDKIPIYSLDAAYMVDKEIGYIKLNRFAATTHEEFVKALNKLKAKGMKHLMLDLQYNGGGYLTAATDLANEFLNKGQKIVYTEGTKQKREYATADGEGLFKSGRLVILIDEGTASSSEIVTGAVQDWDRAVVVGRRSFGKGLVQRPIPLPDGSMIRLTTARYYTPTGRCIQKPYENGNKDAYNMDLVTRYNRGEMISADSIHFPDSLKFNTLTNKRIVYGGGGIMPDYFTPFDTTRYTHFHRSLSARGLINRAAMNYVDANRNTFKKKYPNFAQFDAKFVVGEDVLQDLLRMDEADRNEALAKSKEPVDPAKEAELAQKRTEEFHKSKSLISNQIKALIARDFWDMSEYYEVINPDFEVYNKALEVIKNPKEYDKLLGGKK